MSRNGTAAAAPKGRRQDRPESALKDQAYQAIKERIVTMFYRPGSFLNEAQISEDLNIGRTPVHMAISRLALEDLVEIAPRKGVIVKPLSLDDFHAVYEARMINEPMAAGLAAKRASDDEIRALRQIVRDSKTVKKRNMEEMIAVDRAFHNTIAQAAKSRVLSQILHMLHDRSLRQMYLSWNYDSGLSSDTVAEHQAIVEAISARDVALAEQAMRAHLESSSMGFDILFAKAVDATA